MQSRTHIDHARLEDRPAIAHLLTACGLGADVLDRQIGRWVVAREAGQIVGCGVLEVVGTSGLLRSIAVAASRRRRSIGSTLVSVLLDDAAELGVTAVYAFTRDAAGFFRRLRWQPAHGTDAFSKLGIAPYADTPVFCVSLVERTRLAVHGVRQKTA
ncbi:MAG TPA: GNAT family N-acetyltransferase [Steroidobacteraceae bacterium]|nr:GNAT family N-acetyltransferase [Steroidobacteraceae bacterium]